MDHHNHKCLYTSQATPIKPNYPFSSLQPSITAKNKQKRAYHYCESCSCFHSPASSCSPVLLSFSSQGDSVDGVLGGLLVLPWGRIVWQWQSAVSVSEHVAHGGSASTGWMLKHRHVELLVLSPPWALPVWCTVFSAQETG